MSARRLSRRAALLLAALLLVPVVGLAGAEVTQRGTVRVTFDGELTPTTLPRTGTAPVKVAVGAKIAGTHGGAPPQLRSISIAINRNGRLSPKGLPVCSIDAIQPSTTADALRACRHSLIGEGSFSAKVLLPQQTPFPSSGKVYAFNGTFQGKPAILAHVFGTEPAPTSGDSPLPDHRRKGHLRHRPHRLPAQGHLELGVCHGHLADSRPELPPRRWERQLSHRRLPCPLRVPRRDFPSCTGQLLLCGREAAHLDPDPQSCKVRGR